MDFNYSNEQIALQETLRRFIDRDYGFERRRELARSPLGFSPEAWAQYAELGLLSLPFPEEFGGLGGNAVDIMLVMELVGRGLLRRDGEWCLVRHSVVGEHQLVGRL